MGTTLPTSGTAERLAMAESYGCEVVIERFPRLWLQPGARSGEVEVRLELLPDPLAAAWQDAGLTNPAVTRASITRTRSGDIDLHVISTSDGCGRLADAGVFEALRAAGLAFEAKQEGKGDAPGHTYRWRPGTLQIKRQARPRGGPALTREDFERLLATHGGGSTPLEQAIAAHLGVNIDPTAP
jgi:hypothetical protein